MPHRELNDFPFAALLGDHYLGEEAILYQAPSAKLATQRLVEAELESGQIVALGFGGKPGTSDHLPSVVPELNRVAGTNETSRALHDATPDQFFSEAPSADVLHVSCHARFQREAPMSSALMLRATPQHPDGAVTASAIADLRLDAKLAVLAGCHTGVSGLSKWNESLGLTLGFLAAG